MSTVTIPSPIHREPELLGQNVVVIGGSAGVGFETAGRSAGKTSQPASHHASHRRVVGPADVAALAVHIMTNTALTGATYDIDGGQQFVSG
jgi:hypothetical protein